MECMHIKLDSNITSEKTSLYIDVQAKKYYLLWNSAYCIKEIHARQMKVKF